MPLPAPQTTVRRQCANGQRRALCAALAASWNQGSRVAVEAAVVPLVDVTAADGPVSSAECQVILVILPFPEQPFLVQ